MMTDMDISIASTYTADPLTVFGLLTDRDFLDEVAREQGATERDVQVVDGTTTSRRTLPAPAEAQKFTGKTLTVAEEITWGPAAEDGTRTGQVSLTVPGQPVTMTGTVHLAPSGDQTLVTLTGDLKVKIPLLGRKIEELAAPAVTGGFKVQEKVARKRLG